MHLYKYLDQKKVDRLIAGHLSITPPKYLNDPWEFYTKVKVPEIRYREMFEAFYAENDNAYTEPKETTWKRMYERWTSSEWKESEPGYMRDNSPFGVISFTEDPYNNLMWSHYAGSHKGIVIGFHAGTIIEKHGITAVATTWNKVALRCKYVEKVASVESTFRDAPHSFISKLESWKYEREWRMVERLSAGVPFVETTEEGLVELKGLPVVQSQVSHVIEGINTPAALIERFNN